MAQAGGGPIMDMGIHLIDLIHHVTGMKITHVTAMQERTFFDTDDYDVDDTSTAVLRLENGAQFVVQTLFNVPDSAAAWHFDLFGSKGRMLGNFIVGQEDGGDLNAVLLEDGEDPFGDANPGERLSASYRNLYTEEIQRFSMAVLHDTPVDIPPETAVEAQKVIDAAYESSRTGRMIAL